MLERLRLAINDVLTGNHGGIPAKVVAERMGIPASTLYSYGEVGPTGRDIPVDKLLKLVIAAEDTRPIAALCEDAGGTFFPIPKGSAGAVNTALLDSVKEFGEVVAEIAKDLKDGKINSAEFQRSDREIGEAIQSLAHLRAALQAQARQLRGKK